MKIFSIPAFIQKSIKLKFLIIFILITIIPLITLTIFNTFFNRNLLLKEIQNKLNSIAVVKQSLLENHLINLELESKLLQNTKSLKNLSNQLKNYNGNLKSLLEQSSYLETKEILTNFQESQWGITHHIMISDIKGNIILSPDHNFQNHFGQNISSSPYFYNSLEKLQITDFFGFVEADHYHQLLMMPIQYNATTVAVLIMEIEIGYIEKMLTKDHELGKTEDIFLITLDNKKVIREHQKEFSIIDNPVMEQAKLNGFSVGEYLDSNHQRKLVTYLKNKNYQWYMAVEISMDEVYKHVNYNIYFSILYSILFIIFGILIAIYSSGKITKPILNIIKGIHSFTENNFNQTKKLSIDSSDELGQVAEAFNIMSEKLIKQNREINEYNSILEQKVQIRTEELNKTLSKINETNIQLTRSEEKYRVLIEGTSDIIFTLDKELKFLTINKSIQKHLGTKIQNIIGTNLINIIHTPANDNNSTLIFIKKKIEDFLKTKQALYLKVNLLSTFHSEPKEFKLSLEFVNVDGHQEILGKAIRVLEDAILPYLKTENQIYEFDNFLLLAEDMSHRLVKHLSNRLKSEDLVSIRISIREIIINAIEHGNLAITYEEKTNSMYDDSYLSLLKERQSHPVYGKRKVKIGYYYQSNKVIYVIEDEGDGFDHKKILKKDINTLNEMMETHGRGVSMTAQLFDYIRYNTKGNRVILIKKFIAK